MSNLRKESLSMFSSLNDKPIVFRRIFKLMTQSTNAALLLSQICYWWSTMGKREFYKLDKDFAHELCMTPKEFKLAKKKVAGISFVSMKKKGVPPKTYYGINFDLMLAEFYKHEENGPFKQYHMGPFDENHMGPHNTEITTEITTEKNYITYPQDGRVAPTIEDNTEASKISIEEEKFDLDANKQESGKCGNVLESGEKKQKREPSPEATGIVDRFVSYGLSLNFPSAAERLSARDKAQMATKVDDCVRLDNVSYERIDAIWRWAVRDSFWSQNFRSLAKLRNKNKDGERWVHYLGDKMDLEHRRSGTVNPAIQAERPKPNLTTNAVGEIIDENGRVRDFPELPANWHDWVDELLNQECFRNHPDTQPELVRGKPFRELHRVLQSQIREIARKHR